MKNYMEITPSDLENIEKRTKNVYEAVIVAARRARKINDEIKLEYNTIINSMPGAGEDDFDDKLNNDKIKISKEFDKRPKPHLAALGELIEEKLDFRYKDSQ